MAVPRTLNTAPGMSGGQPNGQRFFSLLAALRLRANAVRLSSDRSPTGIHALPEKKNDCYDAYSDLLDDLLV